MGERMTSGTSTWGAAQAPHRTKSGRPAIKVVLFRESGKFYTEEVWAMPYKEELTLNGGALGDQFYPGMMKYSPDFRRIDGGPVLVESQEPWGYPAIIP